VRELMNHFGLPGMKVLVFAFGHDLPTHPYAPHLYTPHGVVYTGTHDNNTIVGWFRKEAGWEDKQRLFHYLGLEVNDHNVHWQLIRLAMSSVANTVIIPMQDLLGLGEEARMNRPATDEGNWKWRVLPEQITPELVKWLGEMTRLFGRG
jgi:4-alpha-glucanotransferase